jgi:hypothetical protein
MKLCKIAAASKYLAVSPENAGVTYFVLAMVLPF